MRRITLYKILSAVLGLVALLCVIFGKRFFGGNTIIEIVAVVSLIIMIAVILTTYDSLINESCSLIEESVDKSMKEVFDASKVGILIYDESYEIVWLSKLFEEKNLDHMGEKLFSWLPELEHLIKSGQISETVVINEDKYLVSKGDDNRLLFKDITNEYNLSKKNEENAYVLGLLSYDNYDEANESEEDITFINTTIKGTVSDYFKNYEIDCKTLKNNRVLLILNEKKFNSLLEDRFSILNTVRQESKKIDNFITLSMGFARGSDNLNDLDTLAQELLELAQTRGGDQVISRIVGQDAVFYGGSTEARENKSKVKVRAIANSLKELILKSSNVIISGHIDTDADSLGAALCISVIAKKLGKEAYIIFDKERAESTILYALDKYADEINERHNIIPEEEGTPLLNNDSLVIMVDHHLSEQSCAKHILKAAKNIVIIDHHRRKADLDIEPLLVYIEAGSSSACELTAEFLPYLIKKNALTSIEADLMYLGITIDTNHFVARTDERTFDVARYLVNNGADPRRCEEMSREPFEMLRKKAELVDKAYAYKDNILISTSDNDYPRSIASQACDLLIKTKEVDAAFVICNSNKDTSIVTARSNGKVNVQTILENMHGGGHMTAAGLQTNEKSVRELEEEIKKNVDEYYQREEK